MYTSTLLFWRGCVALITSGGETRAAGTAGRCGRGTGLQITGIQAVYYIGVMGLPEDQERVSDAIVL